MTQSDGAERGTLLSILAGLFALLAVSNILKPLQLMGPDTGFVLFGTLLTGTANMIAGPVAGVYLLVYAWGIWRMRRFVVGMAHAYALYVVLNLLLYMYQRVGHAAPLEWVGGLVYAAVAIGVSCGAAIVLTRRKHELR